MQQSDPTILYRRLVEHMNEAVWMGDKDERTVYANPKFCHIMEYSLEEMLGKESYEFWDEESAKRVQRVNQGERKKGVSSSYEGTLVSRTGKRTPVLLSGTPLPDGSTIGIMTDLTELKKKEEKERVLSSAIMYGTDAVIGVDPSGKVRSWNTGARNIFGFDSSDIAGKSLSKIFSKEEMERLLSAHTVQYNLELHGKNKQKNDVVVSVTVCPIVREGTQSPSSILLVSRDITGQRKFEEELLLKYQKMREAYNKFGVIRREMDYVFDLIQLHATSGSRKTVGDFVVNAIIMLSRADACVLRLYDKKRGMLDLLSQFGVTEDWQGKATMKYKGSLAEKAFTSGMPLKVIDLSKEPRYTSVHLAKKHGFCSLLCIPLMFQDALVGSLTLYVMPEKKLELFENEFIEKYAVLIGAVLAD